MNHVEASRCFPLRLEESESSSVEHRANEHRCSQGGVASSASAEGQAERHCPPCADALRFGCGPRREHREEGDVGGGCQCCIQESCLRTAGGRIGCVRRPPRLRRLPLQRRLALFFYSTIYFILSYLSYFFHVSYLFNINS